MDPLFFSENKSEQLNKLGLGLIGPVLWAKTGPDLDQTLWAQLCIPLIEMSLRARRSSPGDMFPSLSTSFITCNFVVIK